MPKPSGSGPAALLPGILLICATAAGLLAAAAPAPGQPVAAVFPPGTGRLAAVAAVAAAPGDWRVVALGAAWPVAVLVLAGGTTSPSTLRQATGAWFTIGLSRAGGCLGAARASSRS